VWAQRVERRKVATPTAQGQFSHGENASGRSEENALARTSDRGWQSPTDKGRSGLKLQLPGQACVEIADAGQVALATLWLPALD
jgi:hypothetical protein